MKSLDEFRRLRPITPRSNAAALQVIAQEAVRMDALTGDATWDHFMSYLQAALMAAEARRDAESVKLRNPMLVNDEAIRICKIKLAELEVRVGTLKEILALPKYLKQQAALAQHEIEEMAARNAG